jgi:hypothetical protein
LKLEHERQMAKYEQEIGIAPNKVREAQFDAARETLKARMPKIEWFTTETDLGKKVDQKGFDKALDDWQARMDALATQFYADGTAGSQTPNSSPPIPPQSADQPPQWYLDLPSGSEYTAPDGTRRIKP